MNKVVGCFMYCLLGLYIIINIGILVSMATGPYSQYFPTALFNCILFNAILYFIARCLINRRKKNK